MGRINLDKIRKAMAAADKVREQVIRESRKVIIASKTAIGAVHRDEITKAESTLKAMEEDLKGLKELVKRRQNCSSRVYLRLLFKSMLRL